MSHFSPLRYPGGKRKISKFIELIFEMNLLSDGYYVEPYAGGASIGLSLLIKEYASRIIINDLDRSIYSFWYSVLYETDTLCKMIFETKINVKNWEKNKELQKDKNHHSLLELGFSTFYLNRTNRSGIITAGIIGGLNQNGKWKMDARFNKKELIKRIEKIAQYKDRITVHNLDANELIKANKNKLPHNTLLFLDPPYFAKGKNLYVNHYKYQDHKAIADTISSLKAFSWIITYDNSPEIKTLYNKYRKIDYSVNYSTALSKKGIETMIFSDNLYVPQDINPMRFGSEN